MVFTIMNTALFLIYSVPAFYVLKKFEFKLDKPAIINIIIYTFCFLIRAIMWSLAWIYDSQSDNNINTFRGTMIILEYISVFILEISSYFFVFEMRSVQTLLRS